MSACQLAQVQGKTTLAASCAQVLGEIRLLPKLVVSQSLSPEVLSQIPFSFVPHEKRCDVAISAESFVALASAQSDPLINVQEGRGFCFFPKSVCFLLGINLFVWLGLLFLLKGHSVVGEWVLPLTDHWLARLELRMDTVFSLDHAWKLFVYAFVHDPNHLSQLIVELLGVWFFGTLVANRYGGLTFLSVTVLSIPLCAFGWGGVSFLFPWLNEIGSYSGMIGPVCTLAGLAVLGHPCCLITLSGVASVAIGGALYYGHSEWISCILPPYSTWWLNFEMMLTGWLVALALGPILLMLTSMRRRKARRLV